jgi:hypothetical protein
VSGAKDRNRGADTERLLVRGLRDLGFPHADRTIRTGHGTARLDLGDVDGTPGLVWQVKSMRPITRAEAMVREWMIETEQQRAAAAADLGVLVVRRDLWLPPRWWAFVDLTVLVGLLDPVIGTLPGVLSGIPVRIELDELCTILRRAGYGEPLVA